MNIAERLKQESFQQGIHTGIEQGMQRGKLVGEQEGIEKGKNQTLLAVAKDLLSQGIKLEIVKSVTQLSDEIIANLIKNK